MRKLLWLTIPILISACAGNINLKEYNNYGLSCSPDAATPPDWDACIKEAKTICAAQKPTGITKHNPTGSGAKGDAYFISFQCN